VKIFVKVPVNKSVIFSAAAVLASIVFAKSIQRYRFAARWHASMLFTQLWFAATEEIC
jgi:hypothetical protein